MITHSSNPSREADNHDSTAHYTVEGFDISPLHRFIFNDQEISLKEYTSWWRDREWFSEYFQQYFNAGSPTSKLAWNELRETTADTHDDAYQKLVNRVEEGIQKSFINEAGNALDMESIWFASNIVAHLSRFNIQHTLAITTMVIPLIEKWRKAIEHNEANTSDYERAMSLFLSDVSMLQFETGNIPFFQSDEYQKHYHFISELYNTYTADKTQELNAYLGSTLIHIAHFEAKFFSEDPLTALAERYEHLISVRDHSVIAYCEWLICFYSRLVDYYEIILSSQTEDIHKKETIKQLHSIITWCKELEQAIDNKAHTKPLTIHSFIRTRLSSSILQAKQLSWEVQYNDYVATYTSYLTPIWEQHVIPAHIMPKEGKVKTLLSMIRFLKANFHSPTSSSSSIQETIQDDVLTTLSTLWVLTKNTQNEFLKTDMFILLQKCIDSLTVDVADKEEHTTSKNITTKAGLTHHLCHSLSLLLRQEGNLLLESEKIIHDISYNDDWDKEELFLLLCDHIHKQFASSLFIKKESERLKLSWKYHFSNTYYQQRLISLYKQINDSTTNKSSAIARNHIAKNYLISLQEKTDIYKEFVPRIINEQTTLPPHEQDGFLDEIISSWEYYHTRDGDVLEVMLDTEWIRIMVFTNQAQSLYNLNISTHSAYNILQAVVRQTTTNKWTRLTDQWQSISLSHYDDILDRTIFSHTLQAKIVTLWDKQLFYIIDRGSHKPQHQKFHSHTLNYVITPLLSTITQKKIEQLHGFIKKQFTQHFQHLSKKADIPDTVYDLIEKVDDDPNNTVLLQYYIDRAIESDKTYTSSLHVLCANFLHKKAHKDDHADFLSAVTLYDYCINNNIALTYWISEEDNQREKEMWALIPHIENLSHIIDPESLTRIFKKLSSLLLTQYEWTQHTWLLYQWDMTDDDPTKSLRFHEKLFSFIKSYAIASHLCTNEEEIHRYIGILQRNKRFDFDIYRDFIKKTQEIDITATQHVPVMYPPTHTVNGDDLSLHHYAIFLKLSTAWQIAHHLHTYAEKAHEIAIDPVKQENTSFFRSQVWRKRRIIELAGFVFIAYLYPHAATPSDINRVFGTDDESIVADEIPVIEKTLDDAHWNNVLIDFVLSSEIKRARETAEVVARIIGHTEIKTAAPLKNPFKQEQVRHISPKAEILFDQAVVIAKELHRLIHMPYDTTYLNVTHKSNMRVYKALIWRFSKYSDQTIKNSEIRNLIIPYTPITRHKIMTIAAQWGIDYKSDFYKKYNTIVTYKQIELLLWNINTILEKRDIPQRSLNDFMNENNKLHLIRALDCVNGKMNELFHNDYTTRHLVMKKCCDHDRTILDDIQTQHKAIRTDTSFLIPNLKQHTDAIACWLNNWLQWTGLRRFYEEEILTIRYELEDLTKQ